MAKPKKSISNPLDLVSGVFKRKGDRANDVKEDVTNPTYVNPRGLRDPLQGAFPSVSATSTTVQHPSGSKATAPVPAVTTPSTGQPRRVSHIALPKSASAEPQLGPAALQMLAKREDKKVAKEKVSKSKTIKSLAAEIKAWDQKISNIETIADLEKAMSDFDDFKKSVNKRLKTKEGKEAYEQVTGDISDDLQLLENKLHSAQIGGRALLYETEIIMAKLAKAKTPQDIEKIKSKYQDFQQQAEKWLEIMQAPKQEKANVREQLATKNTIFEARVTLAINLLPKKEVQSTSFGKMLGKLVPEIIRDDLVGKLNAKRDVANDPDYIPQNIENLKASATNLATLSLNEKEKETEILEKTYNKLKKQLEDKHNRTRIGKTFNNSSLVTTLDEDMREIANFLQQAKADVNFRKNLVAAASQQHVALRLQSEEGPKINQAAVLAKVEAIKAKSNEEIEYMLFDIGSYKNMLPSQKPNFSEHLKQLENYKAALSDPAVKSPANDQFILRLQVAIATCKLQQTVLTPEVQQAMSAANPTAKTTASLLEEAKNSLAGLTDAMQNNKPADSIIRDAQTLATRLAEQKKVLAQQMRSHQSSAQQAGNATLMDGITQAETALIALSHALGYKPEEIFPVTTGKPPEAQWISTIPSSR